MGLVDDLVEASLTEEPKKPKLKKSVKRAVHDAVDAGV
jgi:hypothetical protein